MKRIIFAAAALLALSSQSAKAQSNLPADEGIVSSGKPAPVAAAEKKPAAATPVFVSSETRLNYVAMSSRGDKAIFTGLEGMGELQAVVTNAEGRTMLSTAVSSRQNAINTAHLKKGLYYVTLINAGNDRRRAFVLNR